MLKILKYRKIVKKLKNKAKKILIKPNRSYGCFSCVFSSVF